MKFFLTVVLACSATACAPQQAPPNGGLLAVDAGDSPNDAGSNSDAGPQEQDAGPEGAGLGEPCGDNKDCASGLCSDLGCAENECDAVGDQCDASLICTGGPCGRSCEPKGERGSSCLFFSDDNACPTTAQCLDPLVCGERNFGKFGDGVCVPEEEREEREPCQADGQCSPPLTCDEASQRCA